MKVHAMSLIRSGYAVSLPGILFLALLAPPLFHPGVATAQEVKQIKLTEKHMQGFIAVSEDMAKLYDDANPDKPDPKLEAQANALVEKNGFANLTEYDDVSMNIAMIMPGIDRRPRVSPSHQNRSSSRSTRLGPTNLCQKYKRKKIWRSSGPRSRTQSPFSSRKTLHSC